MYCTCINWALFWMIVFWAVAPCSLVQVYRRFRDTSCCHHQSTSLEEAVIGFGNLKIVFRYGRWDFYLCHEVRNSRACCLRRQCNLSISSSGTHPASGACPTPPISLVHTSRIRVILSPCPLFTFMALWLSTEIAL
jgi:hypothetical protein